MTNHITDAAHMLDGNRCRHKARREERINEALDQSFPASDPPAFSPNQQRNTKPPKKPTAAARSRENLWATFDCAGAARAACV